MRYNSTAVQFPIGMHISNLLSTNYPIFPLRARVRTRTHAHVRGTRSLRSLVALPPSAGGQGHSASGETRTARPPSAPLSLPPCSSRSPLRGKGQRLSPAFGRLPLFYCYRLPMPHPLPYTLHVRSLRSLPLPLSLRSVLGDFRYAQVPCAPSSYVRESTGFPWGIGGLSPATIS